MTDRDHAGLADGTAAPEEHLPRFFGKHGHADAAPNKAKKNGAGRGNWGVDGDEIEDEGFRMTNARRRSNSSSYVAGLKDFKTKFEQIDQEPAFEEHLHGATDDDVLSRTGTQSSESTLGDLIEDEAKFVEKK